MKIRLPWPPRELSPNARAHWAKKSKAAKSYKQQARILTMAAASSIDSIDARRVNLLIEFCPPSRRRMDLDNMLASFKYGIDGISAALGIDDSQFSLTIRVGGIGGFVGVTITAELCTLKNGDMNMSEPPFTMSKYARREDLLADAAQYYEAECLRLRLALEAAHAGLGMAYEALEKECYDEAMLHCGHHHAQTWKALLPNGGCMSGADKNRIGIADASRMQEALVEIREYASMILLHIQDNSEGLHIAHYVDQIEKWCDRAIGK